MWNFPWYPCVFLCLRCVVCPFRFLHFHVYGLSPFHVGSSLSWFCYCTRVYVLCESWWKRPPWLGSVLWIRVSRPILLVSAPGLVDVCTVARNVYVGLWRRLFLVAGAQDSLSAFGLRCKQTRTRSTIASDTEDKPELLPLQTHHTHSNVLHAAKWILGWVVPCETGELLLPLS